MLLERRCVEPELMDQPRLDADEHAAALHALRRVNRLSTSVPIIWNALKRIADSQPDPRPLKVLDLGCGGGDTIVRLADLASKSQVAMEFHGCDKSESAVAFATEAAARRGQPAVQFFQLDIIEQPIPDGYDVVMCSLFLHHFEDGSAEGLLRRMKNAAGAAVVVDDLLRTRLGYVLCWVGCRLLTRSAMVHNDGPQSVRAAVTMPEAKALANRAGLHGATFQRHWPERFLMQWCR